MKFQTAKEMPISLKWKIQLWHALILGILLTALGIGFYYYVKQQRMRELDQWLDQQFSPLVGSPQNRSQRSGGPGGDLGPPSRSFRSGAPHGSEDDRRGPPPHEGGVRFGERPDGAPSGVGPGGQPSYGEAPAAPPPSSGLLSGRAGEPLISAGWEHLDLHMPSIVGADVQVSPSPSSYRQDFEKHYAPLGFYAIVASPSSGVIEFQTSNAPDIEMPNARGPGYFFRVRDGRYREMLHPNPVRVILVGADLFHFQASMSVLKFQIIGAALGLFVFVFGVGYLLVSRSLAPLGTIAMTTRKIAQGELNERVKIEKGETSELRLLSQDLNTTFAKLESQFNRQLRFTADASHELRTPLTALLAQLEYGQHLDRSSDEIGKVLEVSLRSSERIRRITEQLIELSNYDAKRVELECDKMQTRGFLQSIVEELEPYVRQNESEIRCELDSGSVECDPFKIHQVITNLVNNALQHNESPIQIVLKAYQDGADTVIEVIDNGVGIHPENLEQLFDRFFQESESRTKSVNRHNVGLGLSICKAIVDAHGGTIAVTSQPNVRTSFSVRLPAIS